MELEKGMNEYSSMTFDCDNYDGCPYLTNGRCIYNVAKLKIETGRYCHQDNLENYIEDLADHYQ